MSIPHRTVAAVLGLNEDHYGSGAGFGDRVSNTQAREVYQDGLEAASLGLSLNECPYPHGALRNAWLDGFSGEPFNFEGYVKENTDPSELEDRPAERREAAIGQQLTLLAQNLRGANRKQEVDNVAFQLEKLGNELVKMHQP